MRRVVRTQRLSCSQTTIYGLLRTARSVKVMLSISAVACSSYVEESNDDVDEPSTSNGVHVDAKKETPNTQTGMANLQT